MKREAKLLLTKAINSLKLSIDHFNRTSDVGRSEAVLILLDHAFEMLLKASIVEHGGDIKGVNESNTIGFDTCVRKGLSDGKIKFLADNDAVTLRMINLFRDAAQHYLLDIGEERLYIAAQSGVTLFQELLRRVFDQELSDYLPERVLPVSTVSLTDIAVLFEREADEIRKLLQPGRRKTIEALAKLRPLALIDKAIKDDPSQPSNHELSKIGKRLVDGKTWYEVFSGAAIMHLSTSDEGPEIQLRISKNKDAIPVRLASEDENAPVIATKRVNELDYYSLNLTQLRKKFGLNQWQCLAVVWYADIQLDSEYFKVIRFGKQKHKRYSHKAVKKIKEVLEQTPIETIYAEYREYRRNRK